MRGGRGGMNGMVRFDLFIDDGDDLRMMSVL